MRRIRTEEIRELEKIIKEDRKELSTQIRGQTRYVWLTVIAFTLDAIQLGTTLMNYDVKYKVDTARQEAGRAAETAEKAVSTNTVRSDRIERILENLANKVTENTNRIIETPRPAPRKGK